MDYLFVQFGDFSFSRFGYIVQTDRQTDRQTESQMRMIAMTRLSVGENNTPRVQCKVIAYTFTKYKIR